LLATNAAEDALIADRTIVNFASFSARDFCGMTVVSCPESQPGSRIELLQMVKGARA
jgi:hypothetical protein